MTWKVFLAIAAFFALLYFPFGFPPGKGRLLGAIPWMEWPGQVPAWALLGLSSVAAIAYGAHRHRPRAPLAWWFLGGGVLLFVTGDTIYKTWHQLMGQQNIPFPSFIDAIYISMYPVLGIGLLLLAHSRVPGGDQASLLDSLIVTLGIGLVSWIFLIGPNVMAPGGLLVRLTSAAYPLGDVLLLAMLAHLWSAGGLRNTAGRLLTVGTTGTLVADTVYGLAGLHPSFNWHDGNPFDLGWILFYACWGAAALHPSMRELSEPRPVAPPRTSRARLVVLGAMSLVGPVALLFEAVDGAPRDAGAIAGASAVMFLLVVARMSLVVKAHGRAVSREQVLRREAVQLVGAPSRTAIYEAVTRAMTELVGDEASVSWQLAVAGKSGSSELVAAGGGTAGEGRLFTCPIAASRNVKGSIEVRSAKDLGPEVTNVLETLAAQLGLALDREELSDAAHARRSEARFQTLVQNASDVILIGRPDTTVTYVTPSAQRILGYAPGSLEGTAFTSLLHGADRERAIAGYMKVASRAGATTTAEWRVRHSDGAWKHMEVVANNLLGEPTVEGIVLTLRDVSEQKNLENELKRQAFSDALTGLANRALFRDRLEHALARAARSLSSLAVLFLDLDDFKLVNDSLGHGAGDKLLVEVGTRLMNCLRHGDTAARFGGDEFAVLLEETAGPEDACLAAERMLDALRPAFQLDDRSVAVHASVGIAYSKLGHEDPSELLQAADVAMYAAKARGKNCYQLYEPALQEAASSRLDKTAELQRAVDESQFVLHYQPIVSLEGKETIFLEALIRWAHPEKGLVPPMDFINLAEETGLIIQIGRWVLGEACPQVKKWQEESGLGRRLKVTVNISVRHFQHGCLVEDVSRVLETSGLDPSCLVLEITETLLVHDTEVVIARMEQLKDLGVGFAVDDFGTGYSSLSYLKRFPIDILKVDKSFVDDVGSSDKALALADAIVQLGRSLSLDTVAEGIEETRQAKGLRDLGCNYGQGFLFARPVAPDQIADILPRIASGEIVARAQVTGPANP